MGIIDRIKEAAQELGESSDRNEGTRQAGSADPVLAVGSVLKIVGLKKLGESLVNHGKKSQMDAASDKLEEELRRERVKREQSEQVYAKMKEDYKKRYGDNWEEMYERDLSSLYGRKRAAAKAYDDNRTVNVDVTHRGRSL